MIIIRVFNFRSFLRDFGIRTDANGIDLFRSVRRPFAECLAEQRNRRNEEENYPLAVGFLFRDPEGVESFTGSAGHYQLAAVVGLKVLVSALKSDVLMVL